MKPVVVLLLTCVAFSSVFADPFVVIVRHAEKVDNSDDADLSAAGQSRAQALARILKDANITAIFTSERKRTQETAAPLAKSTGVASMIVPAKDYGALIAKLREAKGNALVVGHGNTIPEIIKAVGVHTQVQIPDENYSDLFVVTLHSKPELLRLHY